MFSGGFRTQKLKTGLRLSINRLKLMEKKKTEMAQKARKEISDFISLNKYDRARIRVEHIIREDYLVEAMELVEMYCDLLLARFGLIETMKYCDEALVEAVSSIIWACPRLSADCQELSTVSDQLCLKYGKEFGLQARTNNHNTVNERLINKLSPDPPPKILVERYLIEIAKNYNVPFEPDPDVMMSEGVPAIDSKEFESLGSDAIGFSHFIDNRNNFGPPPPGNQPPGGGSGGGGGFPAGGYSANSSGSDFSQKTVPMGYPSNNVPPYPGPLNPHAGAQPPPYPQNGSLGAGSGGFLNTPSAPVGGSSIPDLPDIPTGGMSNNMSVGGHSTAGGDDVDFDDLTRRFEELKKKK